jgi:tRNA (adenine22-N1)-methyltransferase
MRLSKRLEACLQYTTGFQKLADVGTDHAHLPIEAVLRGNVLTALAIDNKFGPFIQARTNIKKYNVESRVKALLGDGLEKIDNDVDVVVMSGMGGELIADILSSSDHKYVKRFILQANRNVPLLRRYMTTSNYRILDEIILEEQGKTYEILVFEKGKMELTEKEIEFGPIHLRTKPYYWVKHYQELLAHYEKVLLNVTDDSKKDEIKQAIQSIKEALHEN